MTVPRAAADQSETTPCEAPSYTSARAVKNQSQTPVSCPPVEPSNQEEISLPTNTYVGSIALADWGILGTETSAALVVDTYTGPVSELRPQNNPNERPTARLPSEPDISSSSDLRYDRRRIGKDFTWKHWLSSLLDARMKSVTTSRCTESTESNGTSAMLENNNIGLQADTDWLRLHGHGRL